MPVEFLISALVTLVVVVDPIGLVPSYLAITHGLPQRARRSVALRAALIAAAHSGRQRADRRLAVAYALDRFAGVPDCRRLAAVLDRIRNGVRRADRASVATGRAGHRRACAQHRCFPARHSIDGGSRCDHRHDPAGAPAAIAIPCGSRILLAVIVIVARALLCRLCACRTYRQMARRYRQYRRLTPARRAACGARRAVRRSTACAPHLAG